MEGLPLWRKNVHHPEPRGEDGARVAGFRRDPSARLSYRMPRSGARAILI